MATLTPTLTLASTDLINGEDFNLSVTDALDVVGQAFSFQVVATTTGVVFAAAANYTKSYVYLKNLSTTATEIITIEKADGGDEYLTLGAGEFAFFPFYAGAAGKLQLQASANTVQVEYAYFTRG